MLKDVDQGLLDLLTACGRRFLDLPVVTGKDCAEIRSRTVGMKQEALAVLLGVPRAEISGYEGMEVPPEKVQLMYLGLLFVHILNPSLLKAKVEKAPQRAGKRRSQATDQSTAQS